MCEWHQLTKQCQLVNKKTKKKMTKKHGFAFAKHETSHLSQWMQKHPEQHHGMQSSPHYGYNEKGGSPWLQLCSQMSQNYLPPNKVSMLPCMMFSLISSLLFPKISLWYYRYFVFNVSKWIFIYCEKDILKNLLGKQHLCLIDQTT